MGAPESEPLLRSRENEWARGGSGPRGSQVRFDTGYYSDGDVEKQTKGPGQSDVGEGDYAWCCVMRADRQDAVASMVRQLSEARLAVCTSVERVDKNEVYLRLGAEDDALEDAAETMGMKLKLKEYSTLRDDTESDMARFELRDRAEFAQDIEGRIPFTSAQKQLIVAFRIKYVAGVDMRAERANKVVKSFYPVHCEEELHRLEKKALRSFFRQPLDEYRKYFGEKFAMYYAFLDYYVLLLTVPAAMGSLLYVYQLYRKKVDTIYLIPYSFFMMWWATIYLAMWRRKANRLQVDWDIDDYAAWSEAPRDEFLARANIKKSVITDMPEAHYPPIKRAFWKYGLSFPVVVTMVVASLAMIISLLIVKIFSASFRSGPVWVSLLQAIVIMVMNGLYRRVAVWLTKRETHKTDSEYENNLIAKLFVLQFINTYAGLYYTAFFKGKYRIFGNLDKCNETTLAFRVNDVTCMVDVELQLASLYVSMIFFSNITEILIPFAKKAMKQCALPFVNSKRLHPVVEQGKRPLIDEDAPATFMDYNEMVIQFGFLAMFSSAFTLSPLMALINNILEIRVDSLKLFRSYRRPEFAVARDIGLWYSCMDTLVWIGIVTNVFLLGFTLRRPGLLLNVKTQYWRLMMVLIFEHIMVLSRLLIKWIIPRQSKWAKYVRLRRAYVEMTRRDKRAESRNAILTGAHRKYSQVGSEIDEETQRMVNNIQRFSKIVGTVQKFSQLTKDGSAKLSRTMSGGNKDGTGELKSQKSAASIPEETEEEPALKFGERTGKKKPKRKE